MTMRMCRICEANPVASDGKCLVCLKDAAGPQRQLRPGNRRPKTPRGVRTSTPGWVRRRERDQDRRRGDRRVRDGCRGFRRHPRRDGLRRLP